MVAKPSAERKALALSITFVLAATVAIVGAFVVKGILTPPAEPEESETAVEPEPEPEPEYIKYDFQPVIDQFVNSTTGNRSVLVYDVERAEIAGEYNPAQNYNTASLYKLFVVYEGYRRLETGIWDASSKVGYTGRTMLDCLDLAIRESYSPCAESLWAMIGHAELDAIIKNDFGILSSNISGLSSNANDILSIMKIFYNHTEITNETYVARMKDSFLNQPPTTYNWRQGLPSGFSRANVYNKVGWAFNPSINNWDIYHDAAIVEFPEENRHFIVVVMTNRVSHLKIKEFGTNLENYYYSTN